MISTWDIKKKKQQENLDVNKCHKIDRTQNNVLHLRDMQNLLKHLTLM